MKDAIVGSRFQCSLEKGTLQLPPLEARDPSTDLRCFLGVASTNNVFETPW